MIFYIVELCVCSFALSLDILPCARKLENWDVSFTICCVDFLGARSLLDVEM